MNETPLKLAVLGPSQSGKTCLAVGLSAVNMPGFTIEPGTRFDAYLGNLKAELQKGRWPDPDLPDWAEKKDVREIALTFQKKGKEPIPVTFLGFAGERLQDPESFKSFSNQHLDGLDGAVVLVNPGADAFAGDAKALEEARGHYKRLFARFQQAEKKPFVALVVTAADRIARDGDLADRKAAFEEFVCELFNSLRTGGIVCKRFSVTITGHLSSQFEPMLAKRWDNTSARPFLWLLWKLWWKPIWRAFLRKVCIVAIVLAVCAAIAGAWYAVARKNAVDEIDRKARAIENLLDEFGTVGRPSDELLDRVAEAMDHLVSPVAIRVPIILASVTIPTVGQLEDARSLFDDLLSSSNGLAGEVALGKARQLEPKVWNLFKQRIERDILDIKADVRTNATPAAIQSVDNLFLRFVPKLTETAAAEYAVCRAKWESEKAELLEEYVLYKLIAEVEEPLDVLAGKHGEDSLASLYKLYGELAKVVPPKENEKLIVEKDRVAGKLDRRMSEEFHFLIDRDLAAGLPEKKAAEASKRLAEQLAVWNPTTEAGAALKSKAEEKLESKAGEAVKKWMAEQRAICDEWVKREISNQPARSVSGQKGLFEAYQLFARHNAGNPFFLTVVQKAVYERVENSFNANVAWFEKNGGRASFWNDKANFAANWKMVVVRLQGFRQLCSEVSTDTNPRQSSWAWHFASLCMKQGRLEKNCQSEYFPRRIVIDRIDASANYHGKLPTAYKYTAFGAKIDVVRFNDNGTPAADSRSEPLLPFERDNRAAKDSEANAVKAHEKKNDGEKTKTLLSKPRYIDIHAFERVDLKLVATDWNKGTGAHQSSPIRTVSLAWAEKVPFAPAGTTFDVSFKLDRWSGDKHPALWLTVYGRIEGPSMSDLWEQAKKAAENAK